MPQPPLAPTVTLILTEEEMAALAWEAKVYQSTPAARVLVIVQPILTEIMQRWAAARWDARRRVLEADATLAAIVDRAGER